MKKDSLSEFEEFGLLNDYYGSLLPEKQQKYVALYYGENLTLQEIADNCGVSRQAVSDALKKAEVTLRNYEKKLGLASSDIKEKDGEQ